MTPRSVARRKTCICDGHCLHNMVAYTSMWVCKVSRSALRSIPTGDMAAWAADTPTPSLPPPLPLPASRAAPAKAAGTTKDGKSESDPPQMLPSPRLLEQGKSFRGASPHKIEREVGIFRVGSEPHDSFTRNYDLRVELYLPRI